MDPTDEGVSSLERARQGLYRPNTTPVEPAFALKPQEPSVLPRAWAAPRALGAPHHVRFASYFFFIACAFFVLATGVSVYVFYSGSNSFSVANVALTIQGPTTVAGGDTAPLSIVITNNNPTALEDATLEIIFPEGTRSATDVSAAFPRFSAKLGSLASGSSTERSVSAVLFGGEGLKSDIQVSVSFGAARSNAVFVKRSTYPVVISTAPLSVSVDSVSETVSGKPFTIKATVRSNAAESVGGVVLKAQYPTGYVLSEASVTPVGSTFVLGTLKAGESKTITLSGVLTGQNNETRVFHFTVGTSKAPNDPTLAIAYMTQQASLMITAPFLATTLLVNGISAASPAVAPGALVAVGVNWANALAVPVLNAQIHITLGGAALDPNSVKIQKGFYRSADRTIIFSRDTDETLASLLPGGTGFGNFSFSTLTNAPRNSAITLTVSIVGDRVGQSGVPEQVTASATKVIKLVSAVAFTASTLHTAGPFTNTGPIPPVADSPTSYTIVWSVTNTGNELADGVVTASLPAYVAFAGVMSPAGSVTFDPSSRALTWRVGDMPGGSSRQTAFQVMLTPSVTQRGSVPSLTSAPQFGAFDRYAQVPVTTTGAAVTTETGSDPGYTSSKAVVR